MHTTRTNISLRHFRVFLEIVRRGSLRQASQAMHITQSAVSKALRELETELGVTLLERGRKGVRLTPVGEAFHQNATQSLVSFTRAIDVVQERLESREILRIGALPTAAGSIVPLAVESLLRDRPSCSVQVHSGSYEELLEKLRTGTVELIIGRMIRRDMVGLTFEQLYDEDIAVVVCQGHPLTAKTEISAAALGQYPVIVPPEDTTVRGVVNDYFFSTGTRPPSCLLESLSDAFSRSYTMNFMAVWFAPLGVVALDLKAGLLARLPISNHLLQASIGLTTQSNSPLPAIGVEFAHILRALQKGT